MKEELIINRDFLLLTVPKPEEEQDRLIRSLMRDGCKEPIITWQGMIIDGFKRYQICRYEEIDYDIEDMDFDSFEDAVSWVCRQRIPDAPKSSAVRRYLIGRLYLSEKAIFQRTWKQDPYREVPIIIYNRPLGPVRTFVSLSLARELGLNFETVERLGAYATALNRIDELDPDLFSAIMKGEMTFSRPNVIQMAKMDRRKLMEIRRKHQQADDLQLQVKTKRWRTAVSAAADIGEEDTEVPLTVGIKNTPAFDPDMEIKGLSLTIPTWMSAIARAEKKTDMDMASEGAKRQLKATLIHLDEQIHKTLEAIECKKTDS